jgi:hypothetical protein
VNAIFFRKNHLFYILFKTKKQKIKPFTGWPATPYMEPGVVRPPSTLLGVAAKTTQRVVAATPGSWWAADHRPPIGFFFFLVFLMI